MCEHDFSTFNIGVLSFISPAIALGALQAIEATFVSQFYTDKMLFGLKFYLTSLSIQNELSRLTN